jgi:octaheme c-type cytochrome (tetrathionate reductase family)
MQKKQIYFLGMLIIVTAAMIGLFWQGDVQAAGISVSNGGSPVYQDDDPANNPDGPAIPTDHSQFEELQQEFATGPEVTAACLSCHTESAKEIMSTSHWTWEFEHPDTGQVLGKQNVINNFCVAIDSNEPRCTSCHTGYGWKDNTFDFTNEEAVDCLVCHDTTGTYKKFPTAAGHPTYESKEFPAGSGKIWEPPDLTAVAQNVGYSSRETCGACHFYGGGGDAVKHGDMDSSLANPDYELDVHMDAAGLDFTCTTCHTSDGHVVEGSRYAMNSTDEDTCESCHTAEPHEFDLLNGHIDRVACQTCHIPEYARGGNATKMFWDWSQAGELNEDGTIKLIKDPDTGHLIYDSRKGSFEYGENVVPEYIWFNGEVQYTLVNDKFDPDETVVINPPQGSIDDAEARIWPMKVFDAVQPYDSINNNLVIPHLFGKDDAAYWKSFEWETALEAGMAYAGEPYSGSYDFVETKMYWPITHMVAPASEALQCNDCHTPEGGRLDFIALGYDEEAAMRLTHFPPTLSIEALDAPHHSPERCAECHEENHASWMESAHGENGVGCVACHTMEGDAGAGDGPSEHPAIAYEVNKDATLCGTCHLDEMHDWQHSGHAAVEDDAIACVDCHQPHTQQQRINNGNTTSCENCHEDEAHDMPGSTHALSDMSCLDCHKNTEMNTGHVFNVGSDTCISCHAEDAHSASKLVEAGVVMDSEAGDGDDGEGETAVSPTTDSQTGAIINFPPWAGIFPALVLVAGGYWVVAGKDPGSQHKENQ